jgi:hypothetical protein
MFSIAAIIFSAADAFLKDISHISFSATALNEYFLLEILLDNANYLITDILCLIRVPALKYTTVAKGSGESLSRVCLASPAFNFISQILTQRLSEFLDAL